MKKLFAFILIASATVTLGLQSQLVNPATADGWNYQTMLFVLLGLLPFFFALIDYGVSRCTRANFLLLLHCIAGFAAIVIVLLQNFEIVPTFSLVTVLYGLAFYVFISGFAHLLTDMKEPRLRMPQIKFLGRMLKLN